MLNNIPSSGRTTHLSTFKTLSTAVSQVTLYPVPQQAESISQACPTPVSSQRNIILKAVVL